MMITHRMIMDVNRRNFAKNQRIRIKNNRARYVSEEEQHFINGASIGLFSMWNSGGGQGIVLPAELALLIAAHLSRSGARVFALTCSCANTVAINCRDTYLDENGASYTATEELSFLPMPFLI